MSRTAGLVATYLADTAGIDETADGELVVRDGCLWFEGTVRHGMRMEAVTVRIPLTEVADVAVRPLRDGMRPLPRAALGYALAGAAGAVVALAGDRTEALVVTVRAPAGERVVVFGLGGGDGLAMAEALNRTVRR